jgi:NAD(P)-dependent dehydrogenase (short-subunit alcohol dehydrogenase family)
MYICSLNQHFDTYMNIIITGAGSGIGRALTLKLTENHRHRIVAISKNAEKLQSLKKEIFTNQTTTPIETIPFDLTAGDYTKELLPAIISFLPTVDVLVNNAGLLVAKNFSDITESDFDAVFNVNVKSVFKLSQTLLPHFTKPSHILNVSSMGGFQGSAKFPGLSLYSAAKGAVSILTEAMAEELKEWGISVNCLAYGAVQTEMLASAFPGYKAPLEPGEMAEFTAWFATNGHRFFNGKILPVSLSTP